jgi:O-antigen/teichoic acid export membrane protein
MFAQTLRTSIKFVPHQLSDTLLQTANAWMVNGLFSTATLGVYGVGVGFAALIQMPLTNFSDAAYPTLSKLMREGGEESKRQQARIYTLSLLMLVAAVLVQQLFSTVVIRVLTNPAYHEAAQVVPILIFAWLFQAFYAIVVQPVFYFGGGLWLSTATISSIVVSIGVGAWSIPEYGMYGAAWSMAAGFAAKFLVAATASTYLYRLPWELTKTALALACALVVAWIDWAFVDGWLDVVNAAAQSAGFWQRVEWGNLITMIGAKLALLATIVPLWWITGVVTTKELAYGRDLVRGKLRALRGGR